MFSFIMNLLIFLLTFVALGMMFFGHSEGKALSGKRFKAFKYFTVDSNVLMGIVALIYAIQMLPGLRETVGEITTNSSETVLAVPYWCIVLKLVSASAVALTMVTVLVFLGPTAEEGYPSMFTGSNFFFHLIIPLLSILDFIFLTPKVEIPFAHTLYGIIPSVIYGSVYMVNVLKHAENGHVSGKYDWYGFVRAGTKYSALAAVVVISAGFILTVLLWLCK